MRDQSGQLNCQLFCNTFVASVLMLLSSTCFAQFTTTFVNKSKFTIDSITITGASPGDTIKLAAIDIGQRASVKVGMQIANRHGIYPCGIDIAYNKKMINANCEWGGMGSPGYDTIYIFDYGISRDAMINGPARFTIDLVNASEKNITGISSSSSALKSIKEYTPRTFGIGFDYQAFKQNPNFALEIDGKTFQIKLPDSNFLNILKPNQSLWFHNDSIYTGIPDIPAQEFTITIYAWQSKAKADVVIKSTAINKRYYDGYSNQWIFVFDAKKLGPKQVINARINGKKYKLRLEEIDFPSRYYWYKIYEISGSGMLRHY